MKFKDIIEAKILTEGRSEEISKSEFKRLLDSDRYSRGNFWRGVKNFYADCARIDPKKFNRKSLNNYNFGTLIMDNESKWSSFPKRSKSVVFMSSKDGTGFYGTQYLVFPEKTAEVAIAPMADLWHSFKIIYDFDIEGLNKYQKILQRIADVVLNENLSNINFNKLKSQLSQITLRDLKVEWEHELRDNHLDHFEEMYLYTELIPRWENYFSNIDNFYDLTEKFMRPYENDFELSYPDSIKSIGKRELWTEGECLLLKADNLDHGEET